MVSASIIILALVLQFGNWIDGFHVSQVRLQQTKLNNNNPAGFSENVLDHIEYAMATLQARSKGRLLSLEEAKRLSNSMEAIIRDAQTKTDYATTTSPVLGAVAHPAVAAKPVVSSATSGDTSGIGNPLSTRPDLPGTKALIAEGKKTQQQLGKIQTNTWGT